MVKTIGTHSGHFHCDEALAIALLKRTEEFKDSVLVRTRDPAKLAECDIIVNVGGVYDEATHRYDHHQRGFTETFDDKHVTKLSSAGLVYKHFGKEVVGKLLGAEVSSNDAEKIYLKTYDCFVEALMPTTTVLVHILVAQPLFSKKAPQVFLTELLKKTLHGIKWSPMMKLMLALFKHPNWPVKNWSIMFSDSRQTGFLLVPLLSRRSINQMKFTLLVVSLLLNVPVLGRSILLSLKMNAV
ncbi:unnamed protein product [Rhizopus stolonifer]